jgi:hypothetical protein
MPVDDVGSPFSYELPEMKQRGGITTAIRRPSHFHQVDPGAGTDQPFGKIVVA